VTTPDEGGYFKSTEILGASARLATSFHRLVVLHAPEVEDVGRIVPLSPELPALEIGRQLSSDRRLGLADHALSRRHAEIRLLEQGWHVRDLGSRNGLFVAGLRCAEALLEHGSVVRVGHSVLLYEAFQLDDGLPLQAEEPPLLGPSVAMQIVRGSLRTAAAHALPVLLLGASGVGKEMAAEYLHRHSRRDGELVPVNCGALPADLVEAELFGAVAGAFTGANRDRSGLFAAAEGGTILLDEMGEFPLALQPKLLRVLSTGEVRPVGATKARRVDVRVVAATNRDLEGDVEQERFRGDLLARLSAWTLTIPPLCERREDVLTLAEHLWQGEAPLRWSADAAEAMVLYDWPWNVRELRQVCDALAITVADEPLPPTALPKRIRRGLGDRLASKGSGVVPLELRVRRDRPPGVRELREVLQHFGGNVSQVARFFDKRRFQVYRWCEKHELDPEAFRPEEG
jgi:DNA-binding NtrC family response regulator